MKLYSKVFLIVLLLSSCGNSREPVPSEIAHAKPLTNHIIYIQSYEIPKGIFRGVLWPSERNKNFKIWLIDGNKELFWNILAPSEFVNYKEEVTEEWEITISETSKENIVYLAERKDKSRSIRIELPIKKRAYSFSVLNNDAGEEMLIFMDISEDIVDKGIFGYVTIKNKSNRTE